MNQVSPESAIRQLASLKAAGKMTEAEHIFRQMLESPTANALNLHMLGAMAQQMALHVYATEFFRRAIELSPRTAENHYNLSISLAALGQRAEAEKSLAMAIAINPNLAQAHTNLGAMQFGRGDAASALANFERAAALRPNDPLAQLNVGKILRQQDRLDEAESHFRNASAIDPNLPPAWNMLGSCLRESGRIDLAIEAFTEATHLNPAMREAASNLCYASYFDPALEPKQILEIHRQWAGRFAAQTAISRSTDSQVAAPNRRLRIGYVSPNLRSHAVGAFVEPIFAHHDRERFEIIAYSDTSHPDDVTRRLRSNTDQWHEMAGMPDAQLAELIRSDRIDILIDLTLHMRGCRLGMFSCKPAPLQLTHLAYCGTSGLVQMDGCICDVHMATNENRAFFAERLLPLPRSYWCYQPFAGAPEVSPLPASKNGYITFGSLNSLAKVNDRVITTWAQILNRVSGSRLALFIPGVAANPSIFERFEKLGISRSRIDAIDRKPLAEYFAGYRQIDIALDPFPYNGGTTTLDALWMGVPVITLAGMLPVGRAGVSILSNVGLPEMIAVSEEDYVSRAVGVSSELDSLGLMRSTLRERVASSGLLDGKRYVRELEALFLAAWHGSSPY